MKSNSPKMPVLFLGHGNPMYAIESNVYSDAWEKLGKSLPKPKAILAISAHWLTEGTSVTAMEHPETIHDFGGFPQKLFDVQYPAPGSEELAKRVKTLIKSREVELDHQNWGLDHGAWAVLRSLFPNADVPVVQLSLDMRLSAREHYELAKELKDLRNEEILIVASGNVVHNLRLVDFAGTQQYPWAIRFNDFFKTQLLAGHHDALINPELFGQDALISNPTWEHYWPAMYALGLQESDDATEIITDGIDIGSISMLSFKFN
ncbi:MAG: dioxygenase extradiol [Pseudomonadota bacterium]|jgi:4,5-DOPA dioxygenase extradiol